MASPPPWGISPEAEAVAEKVVAAAVPAIDSNYNKETHESPNNDSILASSEDEEIKPKIHKLARTFTQQSIKDANGERINPFDGTDNPLLDPSSERFSMRAWTQTLLGITSRDPERYPQRVAGIAYKNLSAHGFGEATDYQKTFGNYPLETGNLFRRLIGRRQQTKIQILREFDGLVRSGEMLVVLGRPGR